ncbi:MAG TPA: hypothetical protein VFM34_05355, partial [Moraxellaceae bacterium]|nr:hypothetical protein [Moraxellaceae bacterium]
MLKCYARFLARLLTGVLLCSLCGPAFAITVPEALQFRLEREVAEPEPISLDVRSLPQAVATFYAERAYAPAWDEGRYALLLKSLDDLSGDGLNPADYGLAHLRALAAATAPEVIAEREIDATRACLLALLHLYRGKVDPTTLDTHWNFPPRKIDPVQALHEVAVAVRENRIEELFDRARPVWGYYDRLRIALSQLRKIEAAGGWPELPAGPTLKPGMSDPRVPLLRRR